jgi:hypothetical protein
VIDALFLPLNKKNKKIQYACGAQNKSGDDLDLAANERKAAGMDV